MRAVCTTRAGGQSRAPYDALNLGLHVGDDAAAVAANRAVLAGALGQAPAFLNQVHGTVLVQLQGQGVPSSADGAFTRQPGQVCTVMVADCLPVLLCSPDGSWVAALHAGWRGLAGPGGQGVIEAVQACFRPLALDGRAVAAPELIAWLGPCIGPQAFEVGPEVLRGFLEPLTDPQAIAATQACFVPRGPGKWWADLPGLARLRLAALGVERIYGNDGSPPWCTVSNPLRFFSHRRDGISGRMAACIWLD